MLAKFQKNCKTPTYFVDLIKVKAFCLTSSLFAKQKENN